MPSKPDMEYAWGVSSALITEPNDTIKQTGWVIEKPPVEYMNWLQNRMDTFLQHINERGLPEWDTDTSYLEGGQVYASDFSSYTAVQANSGEDPTTDTTNTYWRLSGMAIKSLQRGVTSLSGVIDINVTISSVDVTKTEVRLLGWRTNQNTLDNFPFLDLTGATTLRIARNTTTGFIDASWELTEFY